MPAALALVTLVVADYDTARDWFVTALGFRVLEDAVLSAEKRWLVVAPPGGGTALLLARAATPGQAVIVGNQTGGRVAFFLETDDFARDHAAFVERGVRFLEVPRQESYGTVAVFQDLCGNKWDLIERHGA